MRSQDPLGDIAHLVRQAQRENEQLRRDLVAAHDRRRKVQGERDILKGRINQIADNMDVAVTHLKGAPPPRRGHHILDLAEYANLLRKVAE